MSALHLRPFVPSDLRDLGTVFQSSQQSMGLFDDPHTLGEHTAFRAGLSYGCAIIVAERAGAVAGFLAYAKKFGDEAGLISHLFVHPDHQRNRVGRALLERALETYPAPLELWCFEANAPARALYEAHGFKAVERTDGSNNDEGLPDIRYRLGS